MTLDEWFKLKKEQGNRITEAEFGESIGVGQSQVNRIRRGQSKPSWETIPKIVSETGGLVTANDFAPTEPAE